MKKSKGVERPNFTPLPHAVLGDFKDGQIVPGLLSEMGLAELKVTLAVCRLTFGFRWRKKCKASLSVLQKFTGLGRHAVIDGAARAVDRGVLRKTVGYPNEWEIVIAGEVHEEEPPSDLKKPKEATGRNGVKKRLEKAYCEMTARPAPATTTAAQRKSNGALWWGPLLEMYDLAGGDEDAVLKLMQDSYVKLVNDGMTVSTPKSLVNTARDLIGQQAGNGIAAQFLGDGDPEDWAKEITEIMKGGRTGADVPA